jgi:hypothetical protein
MIRTAIATGAICISALGCAADASSQNGYVLVDPDARAAGVTVLLDDHAIAATLPVDVPAGSHAVLVGARGGEPTDLRVEPGEVTYIEGASARVSHLRIGKDVAADAVRVTGDETSARELASHWSGATVSEDSTGWHVAAPDVFGLAATSHVPAHVLGVAPVLLAADPAAPPSRVKTLAVQEGRTLPVSAPSFDARQASTEAAASVTHVVSPVAFQPTTPCPGVSGVWRGRVYSDRHGEYYDFTLHVARAGSTGLKATITAQFWSASTEEIEPPTACAGEQHVTVVESATGDTDETGTMHLASGSWRVAHHACGERVTDYSPDRFEVPLAMGATTADAVLHDDAVWQDGLPLSLTRVSCL